MPSPTPFLESVAQARAETNGRTVDLIATLTTPLGLVESGTGAFVQDETAGISLYLASADWTAMPAGTLVRVHGTVDDRYAQRTIRLAAPGDVAALGAGVAPLPVDTASGTAGESLEGRVIAVVARVVAGPDTLTDGFAVTVDDGSGPLRIIATLPSRIAPADLPAQGWFRLSGPLGQRDSSGTGSAGYRLYLRSVYDVAAVPDPAPNATPSPAPTTTASPAPSSTPGPSPTAATTASPTPAPTATGSPSPSPAPAVVLTIAAARALPLDSVVTVEGIATVEAGRIVDANTTVIQDATAGIAIRLPAAGWPAFARGDLLLVRGVVGQRYGNLELRPASAAAISVLGHASVPTPRAVLATDFGEAIEGRLVRCSGVVVSVDSVGTSGNFGLDLKDATGTMRVFVYGTTGIARDAFPKGATVEVTGIEGQHAPSTGSTAGHRVWPRDRADVRIAATIQPSPGPTASPGRGSSGRVPIATAILSGGSVVIEGTVTTPPGFVDADGRRIVVEDESGALLVRLPIDAAAPGVGSRIVAGGSMGTYYGSPQLVLDGPPSVSGTVGLAPRTLGAPPTADLAWRLVRVSGQVAKVHRLGTTWRAELTIGGVSVPIYGVARSGVPSTALVEGRLATVTGIVRPPYPTATDRRLAVAPRFAADVFLGGSPAGDAGAANGSSVAGSGVGPGSLDPAAPLDIELGELGDHEGALVRVGGLVLSAAGTRIEIDDGTATAAIVLPPDATGLAGDVLRGDPLNAVGTVVADGAVWAVAPRSAADIARVGRLGELAPIAGSSPAPTDSTGLAPERLGAHGEWPLGTLPTAFALAGTALTMALRRRETLGIGRRLVGVVATRLGR
jgi:hypothetical protein